jgi:hypothetical protein
MDKREGEWIRRREGEKGEDKRGKRRKRKGEGKKKKKEMTI